MPPTTSPPVSASMTSSTWPATLGREGRAMAAAPAELALRVARHGDGLVLDLGVPSGQAVIIDPGGWRITERSPVLFRRTKLTGALPAPQRDGRLEAMRELGL